MKNVLLRLREYKETLTSTETAIAEYIEENSSLASKLTVRELAEKTFASPSTIVRLCRKLGFEGYNDFQKELMVDLAIVKDGNEDHSEFSFDKNEDVNSIIQKIQSNSINIIQDSIKLLDDASIIEVADRLYEARNVLLFGIGASYYVSRDLYLKLLRLNKPTVSNEDYHSMLLATMNSSKDDLAFVFSYSGNTKEMIKCMEHLKENGTTIVSITRFTPTELSKMADIPLYVASTEPIFRKGAMTSRIAMLNIIDIIYTVYISRHYDETMNKLINTHINKDKTV